MRYVIGLDGGGTKTLAVLADEHGQVIRRCVCEATNPNGQPLEQARVRLQHILLETAQGYDISAVFAGVAGTGAAEMRARYNQWVREIFPETTAVRTDSDVCCAITATLDFADGIAAIAGTGSSAFVRVDGAYTQVGGWGYFFEDAGSGFEFGRQALIHWMRVTDGREPPSPLSRLCLEAAGCGAKEALTALYTGGRTEIARFAPCVFTALSEGDPAARSIVARQAEMYAELLQVGGRLLSIRPVPVALGGSIWKQDAFRLAVAHLLGPDFELILPKAEPVTGAVKEALRLLR